MKRWEKKCYPSKETLPSAYADFWWFTGIMVLAPTQFAHYQLFSNSYNFIH